jgi:DNA modification methylase
MSFPTDALPFWDDADTFNERYNPDWSDPTNWHEAANIFPLMSDAALAGLAESIRQHGLEKSIARFEGKVLDGRNRVRACKIAGKTPRFEEVRPKSPLVFVVQANLQRNQLTTTQCAALTFKLLPRFQEEARQRQVAAGKHGAEGGRGRKKEKPSAKSEAKGFGKAAHQAGLAFGITTSAVEKAIKIGKRRPDLIEKMLTGDVTLKQAEKEALSKGKLSDAFGQSPLSVLDTRCDTWLGRKQFWKAQGAVGTHNEQLNRTYGESDGEPLSKIVDGFPPVSSFDPVLAECVCLWFCPPAGRILDPFAGAYVKGIVATKLGFDYVGVENRPEQVRANYEQAEKYALSPKPTWLHGDSEKMSERVPEGEEFDLVFACPPYYDLEKYSEDAKDGSAKKTYPEFMVWYKNVCSQAVARLKWNRFLVVVVGEIRDDTKQGWYRNFVGDNITCFLSLGLKYYNEMILSTAIGNVAKRARTNIQSSRKIGKTHQNVLCFFKGDDPTVLGEVRRPEISAAVTPELEATQERTQLIRQPQEETPALVNAVTENGRKEIEHSLPAPVIEKVDRFMVVRDDLLEGGTKMRVLLPLIQATDFETFVYATSATGYAQIALAIACRMLGRKAVIFAAERKQLHERTLRAQAAGATIVQVPHGYLNVVQGRAREFCQQQPRTMYVPFGGGLKPGVQQLDEFVKEFVRVGNQALTDVAAALPVKPKEVWTAAGSGTLTRALQLAWPDATFCTVRVGAAVDVGRARLYTAPEKYEQRAKLPPPFPFPCCDTYEAKVWQFMKDDGSDGALFWNVAG